MLKINLKSCSNIKLKVDNLIWVFPKFFSLAAGALAKLLFCKGKVFPIFAFLMIYFSLTVIRKLHPRNRLKLSFWYGTFFGIGYFGSSLYWITESFFCVGLNNLAYPAVILLIVYLSLYFSLTFLFTALFYKTRIELIFLFAIFWICFEYARGVMFTGFPWNLISYSSYDISYFPQIADTVGSYGLSFIFVLLIGFLTYRKTFLFGILGFASAIFYGYCKIHYFTDYIHPQGQSFVSVIQPSISQEDKLNFKKFRNNIELQLALSDLGNLYKGKRLIIWPEAAINIPINKKNGILEYISSHIRYDDIFIISGTDRTSDNEKLYNGLTVIGNKSRTIQTYEKRHLLPFGEFIPEFLFGLGLKAITNVGIDFSKGTKSRTINIPGFSKFDALICYEIAFPGAIIDNKDSQWILNITNDSWFKNSDGPSQHLRSACFRALEEGRPILRCANNGISCVIDCNGKIKEKLDTDVVGRIDSKMPQTFRKTIYSKYKEIPIFLIILFIILGLIIRRNRR
jgi:apolipoprotein N-acyltransferase